MRHLRLASLISRQSGNVFAMIFAGVAMVGVMGVATMNLVVGPATTVTKVTNQNMAQNDLLMNAKVVVMNAATRPNGGDEDGDGYIEPAPFIPTSEDSCAITLPGEGGCLPMDIGAIQTDPWGTQYAYCVWDHGSETGSANRIAGEDSTSGAVIAIISAGPNRQFETPCLPYDGDPETNDIAIDPDGVGDDLVQIFTYAGAVSGSGGLWELKQNEPTTAVIDKRLEVGDLDAGTGFAFDTETGQGEFPYIKTDFIASKSGGTTPVTMDSNIALDGNWLSGDGDDEGIFVADNGRVGIGTSDPRTSLEVAGNMVARFHGIFNNLAPVGRRFWALGTNNSEGHFFLGYRNDDEKTPGSLDAVPFRIKHGAPHSSLHIHEDGNVGIGTGSPNQKLQVNGAIVASNAASTFASDGLYLQNKGSGIFDVSAWRAGANSGTLTFSTGSGTDSAPVEKMRIAANGDVGIGTNAPASALHVLRNENSAQVIRIQNTSAGAAAQAALTLNNNAGHYANFGLPGSAYVGSYATNSSYWNTSAPAGMSLFSQSASGTIRFYT